jgi:NAD(P)-dependent dehydrogenase (short-subunit alcohol dehydrogenase family)
MRTALVVGGSRGLGWCLVKQLREQGMFVHVWSRRPPPSLSGVQWARVDLSRPRNAPEVPEGVDTVFHVAASGRFLRGLEDFDLIEFQRVVSVNLLSATMILVRSLQALPAGGRYCYVSSLSALLPSGGWCLYGATKAGADHIVRSMRAPAAGRGISVTIGYPGVLETGFHEAAEAPPPSNATLPDEVAAELIRSVVRRAPLYVASMDRHLVELDIAPDAAELLGRKLFPELG